MIKAPRKSGDVGGRDQKQRKTAETAAYRGGRNERGITKITGNIGQRELYGDSRNEELSGCAILGQAGGKK